MSTSSVGFYGDEADVMSLLRRINGLKPTMFFFIASTRVSTIPGISIAGANPELTLYTPALDIEYLVYGKPRQGPIPVTPEGIPTPAIITRAILKLTGVPFFVVDCGSYIEPDVPHIDLPGKSVGGRIDVENALPEGISEKLFRYAEVLGNIAGSSSSLIVVGESMPGGTTTAMSIMESLGVRARGRVSSASPTNPHSIKEEVFRNALRRCGCSIPVDNVFKAVSIFGDPLHISIAGFVAGALKKGATVLLAGGTQMCSVLAILRKLGIDLRSSVAIATTRWIVADRSSDIIGLVNDTYPGIPVFYTKLDFSKSRFSGLRMYEHGYVKEGVGAGGAAVIAHILWSADTYTLLKLIEEEYEAINSMRGT